MIGIALCDDERYLLGELEALLYRLAKKHKIRIDIDCFENGAGLLEKVEKGERFDILYIDIQMDGMNGLETAGRIRELDWNMQLAYVTSYESYMKDAFQSAPIAFIVKPIDEKEFENTFLFILRKLTRHNVRYHFRYRKTDYKVLLCDIMYFESNLREVRIVWKGGILKEYNKLDEIEKRLIQGEELFLRIHQSYLVNYRYVAGFRYNEVIMDNGTVLPLSRRHQKQVEESLMIHMEK